MGPSAYIEKSARIANRSCKTFSSFPIYAAETGREDALAYIPANFDLYCGIAPESFALTSSCLNNSRPKPAHKDLLAASPEEVQAEPQKGQTEIPVHQLSGKKRFHSRELLLYLMCSNWPRIWRQTLWPRYISFIEPPKISVHCITLTLSVGK